MRKSNHPDIDFPEESLLIGTAKNWDPAIFKKDAKSYADYIITFDKHSNTKDNIIAKKAFSYMAMGERGLLARGHDAIKVFPYILKNTTHPWVKESLATIAGILMDEANFKEFYIALLQGAESDEATLDIMGVAACFKSKKRARIVDWIRSSSISDELKDRIDELI